MAYHNRLTDGTMMVETISTQLTLPITHPISINCDNIDPMATGTLKVHDDKVNTFNSEHNVFFNTSETVVVVDTVYRLTTCLYADGQLPQKEKQMSIPDDYPTKECI